MSEMLSLETVSCLQIVLRQFLCLGLGLGLDVVPSVHWSETVNFCSHLTQYCCVAILNHLNYILFFPVVHIERASLTLIGEQ